MLCSLPNRCVHHHRPTARVGFCLPNIGVPLTVCLFLTNRRPFIFKLAPTACDHHFLADTMITCSSGVEHEMIPPPTPHYSQRPFRVPVDCGCGNWGSDILTGCCFSCVCFCFLSGGDVYYKCREKYPPHPSFCLNSVRWKCTFPGCLSGRSEWSIKNGSYSVTLHPVK